MSLLMTNNIAIPNLTIRELIRNEPSLVMQGLGLGLGGGCFSSSHTLFH